MIKKTSGLIESISRLNKKKPLKEAKDMSAVLFPADYDAQKQHEEALKANAKRRDPKNYSKEVKDFIKATASEESRYRHFDVVDRKDLAKKINEAKEKGLSFKISRSMKEGYRYDFKVLKEEFVKKDAGIPEVNTAMFNKATNIGSPIGGLGEDLETSNSGSINAENLLLNILQWLDENVSDELDLKNELFNYLVSELDYDEELLTALFDDGDVSVLDSLNCLKDESKLEGPKLDGVPTKIADVDDDYPLDEELKIYTSSLQNFHPSERAKKLWDEIRDADKIPDLEYALETLYEDGISDQALDDMLIHEEDWIRDLIDLEPAEDDDDLDYPESEYSEEDEENKEPLEYSEDDEDYGDYDLEVADDTDDFVDEFDDNEDIEPIAYGEEPTPQQPKAKEESEEEKEVKSKKVAKGKEEKGIKEDLPQSNPKKDLGPNSLDYTEEDLIDGALRERSKIGSRTDLSAIKEDVDEIADISAESSDERSSNIPELSETLKNAEEDDEIIAIDEDTINNMMGFQKKAADQEKEAKKG